jgi:hypothetical protein
VVLLITLSILGLIAWALVRLATLIDDDPPRAARGSERFRVSSSGKPVPAA